MKNYHASIFPIAAAAALLFVGGCGSQEKEDEHAHHHHHGSDTPHGGHLIDLEPSDYTAEWTHDDKAGTLTIYILDREGEKDVPIAADLVKIKGDKPTPFEYPLIAVDPSDENPPTACRFQNSKPDPKLLTSAKMGEAVGATLEFEVGGKTYRGVIKHDDHH